MCELCSHDNAERELAEKTTLSQSLMAEELAQRLNLLAHRKIKPHTDEAKLIGENFRRLVRELAPDWL
jgi:hypothetical protein